MGRERDFGQTDEKTMKLNANKDIPFEIPRSLARGLYLKSNITSLCLIILKLFLISFNYNTNEHVSDLSNMKLVLVEQS